MATPLRPLRHQLRHWRRFESLRASGRDDGGQTGWRADCVQRQQPEQPSQECLAGSGVADQPLEMG